ncbi:hypothetical protein A2943_00200 [Candidatus Adlerbacteria bacterium RIFCSPLOWO2_01_FULL_51_16]|uniref:Uncharacterized protein n=1 Tax=Candidatus Adlerbacteria bacterium RIFCSPLOWO2_01_FULL_51_16 TaxID=1797243 RepID=A0A1F4XFC0_9BACT|nr:MAG: hypothetical protein A2943_00200 [Candidatus Adlerbacteria bacterium RIFCSPLOWO2_01_FULL_51_16]
MSKEAIVIALGGLVVITTQLGIPGSWRTAIIVLSGIALIVIGFILRAEALSGGSRRTPRHHFVENGAPANPDVSHEQRNRLTPLN